jgi:hypothetical protein
MSIQIQGNGGVVADVDGSTFRAIKVTPRPTDHGALGAYCYGAVGGIIPAALAANSEIFQFRWSDATRICIINQITISAAVTTTFFAAGVPVQLDLVKATGWTVAGTGGTRATPAALLKKRTSMGSTLVAASDIAIVTTAALGAGTKTLETVSINALLAPGPITASLNGQIIAPKTIFYQADVNAGEHPLTLVQNEGFVIRSIAVPATGTWQIAVTVDWTEVTSY